MFVAGSLAQNTLRARGRRARLPYRGARPGDDLPGLERQRRQRPLQRQRQPRPAGRRRGRRRPALLATPPSRTTPPATSAGAPRGRSLHGGGPALVSPAQDHLHEGEPNMATQHRTRRAPHLECAHAGRDPAGGRRALQRPLHLRPLVLPHRTTGPTSGPGGPGTTSPTPMGRTAIPLPARSCGGSSRRTASTAATARAAATRSSRAGPTAASASRAPPRSGYDHGDNCELNCLLGGAPSRGGTPATPPTSASPAATAVTASTATSPHRPTTRTASARSGRRSPWRWRRERPAGTPTPLLEALRQNLHVLGELAVRYEVETLPERDPDAPALCSPAGRAAACWGRRWRHWRRSRCACSCSTARTGSWGSG